MSSKSKALAVAKRFGFLLDEENSGNIGGCYTVIFDHMSHSIASDCRSITVCDYGSAFKGAAACAWAEAIERMEDEGPLLEPCRDPECDYHADINEGEDE